MSSKYTKEQLKYIKLISKSLVQQIKNDNEISDKLVKKKNGFSGSIKDNRSGREKNTAKLSERETMRAKVYKLFKKPSDAKMFMDQYESRYSGINRYSYFMVSYPSIVKQLGNGTSLNYKKVLEMHTNLIHNMETSGTVSGNSVMGDESMAGNRSSAGQTAWAHLNPKSGQAPNTVKQSTDILRRFGGLSAVPEGDDDEFSDNRAVPPSQVKNPGVIDTYGSPPVEFPEVVMTPSSKYSKYISVDGYTDAGGDLLMSFYDKSINVGYPVKEATNNAEMLSEYFLTPQDEIFDAVFDIVEEFIETPSDMNGFNVILRNIEDALEDARNFLDSSGVKEVIEPDGIDESKGDEELVKEVEEEVDEDEVGDDLASLVSNSNNAPAVSEFTDATVMNPTYGQDSGIVRVDSSLMPEEFDLYKGIPDVNLTSQKLANDGLAIGSNYSVLKMSKDSLQVIASIMKFPHNKIFGDKTVGNNFKKLYAIHDYYESEKWPSFWEQNE